MKVLADILQKLVEQQKIILNGQGLKNQTLIGNMYEGLTKKFLKQIDLSCHDVRVVSGIITSGDEQTDQIDCMVVFGEGKEIPCTPDYSYPIEQVIAVFEIKKELYSRELQNAYAQLGKVFELSKRHYARLQEQGILEFGTARPAQEFQSIFGRLPGRYEDNANLPTPQRVVYHNLVRDWLTPLRIAIGYNGYQSERALRNGLFKLYKNNEEVPGYGVVNMPNLMISDGYSILKLNGMPYKGFWHDEAGGWCWLASSSVNPLLLVLELLYDRVELLLKVTLDRGLDLDEEPNFPLMFSKPIEREEGRSGWIHSFNDAPIPEIDASQRNWEPFKISSFEKDFFRWLHINGPQAFNSTKLIDYLEKNQIQNIQDAISSLLKGRAILASDTELSICPGEWGVAKIKGEFYCGDDAGGRFARWLSMHAAR